MALPGVASEPNVVAASRRPGASVNRAAGAPAQRADSFASALDTVDNTGGAAVASAATGEPATPPAATAPSDPTVTTGKGQPAATTPSDVKTATASAPVGDGLTAALNAIAIPARVSVSTDRKVT